MKRSINRVPGPTDHWWKRHQEACGGSYIKIKEPEGYEKRVSKKKVLDKGQTDIRSFGKINGQVIQRMLKIWDRVQISGHILFALW